MRLDTLHAAILPRLFDSARARFIGMTAAVAGIDLMSKEIAVGSLGSTEVVTFTDRFSLFVVFNTGSAGGIHVGPYTWQLNVLVTLLAVGLIASVVQAMAAVDRRATRALSLVAGGAVGNLLSMLFGPEGVADFLGIRLTSDTTIVANLADFALWAGAVMLAPVALRLLRLARAERAQRAALVSVELEAHVGTDPGLDSLRGPGRRPHEVHRHRTNARDRTQLSLCLAHDFRAGRATRRGEAHIDLHVGATHVHLVDQSEIDNVEIEIRVFHAPQHEPRLIGGNGTLGRFLRGGVGDVGADGLNIGRGILDYIHGRTITDKSSPCSVVAPLALLLLGDRGLFSGAHSRLRS